VESGGREEFVFSDFRSLLGIETWDVRPSGACLIFVSTFDMTEENVIEAKGLRKRFRDVVAVDGIDFAVRRKECFGFLGPNGAGKTTTVRMAHCFTPPTSGELRILGYDVTEHPRCVKACLGVCPQDNNLDPDLTVFDNLRVFARYFDIPDPRARERAGELLRFIGLFARRTASIDELSGGMKRRLLIARALLNQPQVLILDEPTTGLDPQARHQIWETIIRLKEQGTTVLLTTHYMDEAQHLCDRLVIMDHGRILLEGPPRRLIREQVGADVIEIASADPGLADTLRARGITFEKSSTHYYIFVQDGGRTFHELAACSQTEACILRTANLEDVFLKATGRDLRE
jgi:lipooligosaccharide transport system ATP-binding protein